MKRSASNMSSVFENLGINQSTSKSIEAPRDPTYEDSSSDSDEGESRSSLSFRSEDMSDVSRESAKGHGGHAMVNRDFLSLKSIKLIQVPQWLENDPRMLQVETQTAGVRPSPENRGFSKKNSIVLIQQPSLRAAVDKISEAKRLWWDSRGREVLIKVEPL